MSSQPRFPIITVCRNEAVNIGSTCHSIVAQTHDNYEWIVINRESTDGTLDILKKYEKNITSLSSEFDEGIYDAMNKGLEKARGKYVIFMNGGDAFASHQVLDWVATAPQTDVIYGDLYHDSLSGPLIRHPDRLDLRHLRYRMMPHQTSFFRRSLFDEYGNYDTSYRIAANYDFLFVCSSMAKPAITTSPSLWPSSIWMTSAATP